MEIDGTGKLGMLHLQGPQVQMNMRCLYQSKGCINNSLHCLYLPVPWNKLLCPLLILTILLVLHLQPLLPFQIQKPPMMPMFVHIKLQLAELESQLIHHCCSIHQLSRTVSEMNKLLFTK